MDKLNELIDFYEMTEDEPELLVMLLELRRHRQDKWKQRAEAAEERAENLNIGWLNCVAQRDQALSQLSELARQEPVACKKRLVNHRSGVAHHWTYHGQVDRPSSGDIFRVEVVPLYVLPAPAAVPDGWKLVPAEPTKKMHDAYYEHSVAPISKLSVTAYRAMLEATPEPPSC